MATYYVSTSGNDGNNGTSTGTAWRTIQKAVDSVGGGDRIEVMAGTYNEQVVASVSGTSGNEITLTHHGDRHSAIIGLRSQNSNLPALRITGSHWVVDGIKVDGIDRGGIHVWGESNSITNVTIQNCMISNQVPTDSYWPTTLLFVANEPHECSYCYALNNHLKDVYSGVPDIAAVSYAYNENITCQWNTHHVLIQGNLVENGSYIVLDCVSKGPPNSGKGKVHHVILDNNKILGVKDAYMQNGLGVKLDGCDYVVAQNNYIEDADGLNNGCEPYSDSYKTGRDNPYKYNLFRNNVHDATTYSNKAWWGYLIGADRFGSAGNYTFMSHLYNVHNVSIYADPSQPGVRWSIAKYLKFKNNISVCTNAHTEKGYLAQRYYSAWSLYQSEFSTEGWEVDGNIWHVPGDRTIWEWPDGTTHTTFSSWQTHSPNDQFAYPVYDADYILTSSSPGYQDGVRLTYAVGNGSSSTSLTVNDAGYFCDGFGLIDGDTIYVGGTEAKITSVDYDTNQITLESAISWSNGDDVGYAANPSIGVLAQAGSTGVISGDKVVADAGPNQTVYDSDGNGSESVTLDGSNSRADAGIASYVWTPSGLGISSVAQPTVTLNTGTTEITLTVTDNDGNTDTDTVTINVEDVPTIEDGEIVNQDPGLSTGLGGVWNFYSDAAYGANYSASASNGVVTISGSNSGGGRTQLMQIDVPIVSGASYKMTVRGSASPAATIYAQILQNVSPYTIYQNHAISLTSSTSDQVTYFTASNTNAECRLRLSFPDLSSTTTIAIDTFQLEIDTGGEVGPSVTLQPSNQTVTEGSNALFGSTFSGTSPTYRWYKTGVGALANGSKFSGANLDTLIIYDCAFDDQGSYYCTATNGEGSATTNSATLTVTPSAWAGWAEDESIWDGPSFGIRAGLRIGF